MRALDGGCSVIIKSLAELTEPDQASLAIRPLDIDPAAVAEGVAEYRQRLVDDFELIDAVPESTRNSYDRVRTIYSYGIFCYDLYTVAGTQARLVLEQALRERFLPFYGGTAMFIDRKGCEHQVTAGRFSDLFDRGNPLVKSGWRLKLRSGREPILFNGMLTSLLRWAREERLLGGQRDRWQDKFRVLFRNYAAHSEYLREMPDDAAAEIFHLSELINQIWGAPGSTPIRREIVALAWTDTAIMYGLAEGFHVEERVPPDATCVVVRADLLDHTLGNSFDTLYEMTAHPFDYLWGPGTWSDAAQWLGQESLAGDEFALLDRLFLLRYHDSRLYMPRSACAAAALEGHERTGSWYLLRADYPADAFGHQRQILAGTQGHSTNGFCRDCPVETIAAGSWHEVIDHCAAAGADITPRPVPDIRSTMCRIPRWNQLTKDGQWVFPAVQ
jgi:hypothetical protein